MQTELKQMTSDEKLDAILMNQQTIYSILLQILGDTNKSRFTEDYFANLAAVATEFLIFNKR